MTGECSGRQTRKERSQQRGRLVAGAGFFLRPGDSSCRPERFLGKELAYVRQEPSATMALEITVVHVFLSNDPAGGQKQCGFRR